jgi:hypothetical protein
LCLAQAQLSVDAIWGGTSSYKERQDSPRVRRTKDLSQSIVSSPKADDTRRWALEMMDGTWTLHRPSHLSHLLGQGSLRRPWYSSQLLELRRILVCN